MGMRGLCLYQHMGLRGLCLYQNMGLRPLFISTYGVERPLFISTYWGRKASVYIDILKCSDLVKFDQARCITVFIILLFIRVKYQTENRTPSPNCWFDVLRFFQFEFNTKNN